MTWHDLMPGADGEQFQILLLFFSSLVFVFGDYVVAVLPKLLPGSVLVWLSAELMAFWVWNSLRFLRAYEYCLVWVMILMCLGCDIRYLMISLRYLSIS